MHVWHVNMGVCVHVYVCARAHTCTPCLKAPSYKLTHWFLKFLSYEISTSANLLCIIGFHRHFT